MQTIAYPQTPLSESALTHSRRAPVPLRFACGLIVPDFIEDEADGWNCNLCGSDRLFYAPYVKGDIIPFQTQFADNYNPNIQNPANGIKSILDPTNHYVIVELLDGNGVTISDSVNTFAPNFWVGWDSRVGSLQTWFVDTDMVPTSCWRLKVTYIKRDEFGVPTVERIIYSEEYKEIQDCEQAVKIESIYAQSDCNGNWYQLPTVRRGVGSLAYYNSMRIFGTVEYLGETESTEENDRGVVTERTITKNYRVSSLRVPPYFVQRLAQTIRGLQPTVEGEVYKNFSFGQKSDGNMFNLDLTFDSECRIFNKNCNF
jgi:hypothetical protein